MHSIHKDQNLLALNPRRIGKAEPRLQQNYFMCTNVINPRRACAVRVITLGMCVCLSPRYRAYERYQYNINVR